MKSVEELSIEAALGNRTLTEDQMREAYLHWMSRPMEERLGHVEVLRRAVLGEDYAQRHRLCRSVGGQAATC